MNKIYILRKVELQQISSMTEAQLKRFETTDSRFVKNNFFKTMLSTMDFTNNEFVAPMVSTPPIELKGVIINMFQAEDLIGKAIGLFKRVMVRMMLEEDLVKRLEMMSKLQQSIEKYTLPYRKCKSHERVFKNSNKNNRNMKRTF